MDHRMQVTAQLLDGAGSSRRTAGTAVAAVVVEHLADPGRGGMGQLMALEQPSSAIQGVAVDQDDGEFRLSPIGRVELLTDSTIPSSACTVYSRSGGSGVGSSWGRLTASPRTLAIR